MDNQDGDENTPNTPNAEGEREIPRSALEGADAEVLRILENLGSLEPIIERLLNTTRQINNRLNINAHPSPETEDVPPNRMLSHEPSQQVPRPPATTNQDTTTIQESVRSGPTQTTERTPEANESAAPQSDLLAAQAPVDPPPVHCEICHEGYDNNQKAPITLRCGHTTCLECIHGILRSERRLKCPTCRGPRPAYPPREPIPGKSIQLVKMLETLGWLSSTPNSIRRRTGGAGETSSEDTSSNILVENTEAARLVQNRRDASHLLPQATPDEDAHRFATIIEMLYEQLARMRQQTDAIPYPRDCGHIQAQIRDLDFEVNVVVERMVEAGSAFSGLRRRLQLVQTQIEQAMPSGSRHASDTVNTATSHLSSRFDFHQELDRLIDRYGEEQVYQELRDSSGIPWEDDNRTIVGVYDMDLSDIENDAYYTPTPSRRARNRQARRERDAAEDARTRRTPADVTESEPPGHAITRHECNTTTESTSTDGS